MDRLLWPVCPLLLCVLLDQAYSYATAHDSKLADRVLLLCIGVAKGRAREVMHPKCLENIVILCFERRFSKQNSVTRLKSSILASNFWAGYATVTVCHHKIELQHFQWMEKIIWSKIGHDACLFFFLTKILMVFSFFTFLWQISRHLGKFHTVKVKFLIKAQATNTSKIGNVCNVNSSPPPVKQIPVKMATSQLCIKPIIVQYSVDGNFWKTPFLHISKYPYEKAFFSGTSVFA